MSDAEPTPVPRVRVWDVPTRVTHWLFLAGVLTCWWTAETGRMEWHRWSGYTLLALVLFRLYWGFFGSSTARFASFVRGPRAIVDYLKGNAAAVNGHNPLGALSVLGLLGLLLAQVLLGLFAVDVDGLESGPMSMYVSFETGRVAAEWHEWVFNALMTLIVIHVIAVLYYLLFRRQNLVGAMFTGKRRFASDVPALVTAAWWKLAIGVLFAGSLTWAASKAFDF
jgi:cytochrome b